MLAVDLLRRRFKEWKHGHAQRWREIVMNDPCPYCVLTPRADFGKTRMTIEHVEPVALGGSNRWDNIVAAHEGCNHQLSKAPLLRFLLYRQRSDGQPKKIRRQLRREFFKDASHSHFGPLQG